MSKAIKILLLLLIGCPLLASGQNINRQMVRNLLAELPNTGTDTNRIRVLIELAKFQVYKPGEVAIDLDSGHQYLMQARTVNEAVGSKLWAHRIESMVVMYYMESGDSAMGRSLFSQLLVDCDRTNDVETAALAKNRMGVWQNYRMHNYAEAEELYNQARVTYHNLHQPELEIEELREIAYLHMNQGKMNLADSELQQILIKYKAIGSKRMHYAYDMLVTINRLKGDFKKGLYYGLKCQESMERTGDTLMAGNFYGSLARMYYEVGNKEKSLEYYKKSVAKWREEKIAHFSLFFSAGFIVRDMISHHQAIEALRMLQDLVSEIPPNTRIQKACVAQHLAYCYDAMRDRVQAEKYFIEAVDAYQRRGVSNKKMGNTEVSLQAESDLGGFYLREQNWANASTHLNRALTAAPEQNSLAAIRDIHGMLFSVDSAQGDYLSAINHLHLQKLLNDSIFGETKSRQMQELEVQYETTKKEQEIELLVKRAQLQQSQLDKEKLTHKVTIGTILFLLLLCGMGFNRYRLKQRNNKVLENQQRVIKQKNLSLQNIIGEKDVLLKEKEKLLEEKEWLVREIHHRVKNNMQIVISLLNSQSSYLSNADAVAAIKESQHRLNAMSLIHQKLYQKDTLSVIQMDDYIHQLVDHLDQAGPGKRRIRFEMDIDAVVLDVSIAVPVGLILNEAITNAIKYAFPGENKGQISITMKMQEEGQCVLIVADNGIGLPDSFNIEDHSSMGLNLIKMMAEQLNGSVHISGTSGTVLHVWFSTGKNDDEDIFG